MYDAFEYLRPVADLVAADTPPASQRSQHRRMGRRLARVTGIAEAGRRVARAATWWRVRAAVQAAKRGADPDQAGVVVPWTPRRSRRRLTAP